MKQLKGDGRKRGREGGRKEGRQEERKKSKSAAADGIAFWHFS